jgi:hypothetical protein
LEKEKSAENQHLLALALREEGRILARMPGRRAEAADSLGRAIEMWDGLQKRWQYPAYRESQALAFLTPTCEGAGAAGLAAPSGSVR